MGGGCFRCSPTLWVFLAYVYFTMFGSIATPRLWSMIFLQPKTRSAMSLSDKGYDVGILMPEEVALVTKVFRRVAGKPWVSKKPADLEALGRYILAMYQRGMCDERRLLDICMAASRRKFAAKKASPGLTVEKLEFLKNLATRVAPAGRTPHRRRRRP